MKLLALSLALVAGCAGARGPREGQATRPDARLAPHDAQATPEVQQIPLNNRTTLADRRLAEEIAPYVEQARATYPDARRRYLAGLPDNESFYVTIMLHDEQGHFEQVFVLVTLIENGIIRGRLASDVQLVEGHQAGEWVRVPEGEILDWTIQKDDGQEEGNFVGKFLDSRAESTK